MSYLFERANEAAIGDHGVDESWLAEKLINFANEEVGRHKTALRELREAAEKLTKHCHQQFGFLAKSVTANLASELDAAIQKAKEMK